MRTLPFSFSLSVSLALLTSIAACETTTESAIDAADAATSDAPTSREASAPEDSDDGDDPEPTPGPSDAGSPSKDAGKDAAQDASTDASDAALKDCGPPGLVFTSPKGPFCPFQAGAVFDHCAVGEHCCHYAEDSGASSTCESSVTACGAAITDGIDWRCDEGNDCPGGQVCCFGGPITAHPQCLGQYKGTGSSTACRANTCLAGETRTCGTQADCPLGTTCTGMRMRGKHIGFCKP